MASKEKISGGDFILESRHLVGLFLLLVVIFGVVFTLGYLLGRSQYDSQLRAVVGPPPGSDVQAASPASKSKTRPESEVAQLPKGSGGFVFSPCLPAATAYGTAFIVAIALKFRVSKETQGFCISGYSIFHARYLARQKR